jgi:hypothetical protein
VTVEDTAEDVWPDFETLAEGDEDEIESYLGELAAQPEGQAFSPSIATIRRRKRLLSPSLRAFVLDTDAFVPLSSASGQRLPRGASRYRADPRVHRRDARAQF